jgi:hypothetical protein
MKRIILGAAAAAATLTAGQAMAQTYRGYDRYDRYERYDWRSRDSDRDGVSDRREWNRDRDRDGRPDQWDRYDNRRHGWRHHHHRRHHRDWRDGWSWWPY